LNEITITSVRYEQVFRSSGYIIAVYPAISANKTAVGWREAGMSNKLHQKVGYYLMKIPGRLNLYVPAISKKIPSCIEHNGM
jgi:hypothetical protein